MAAKTKAILLSKVLRRLAYPFEPLGFEKVQGKLPMPLVESNRDRMGEQADLFEKANRCMANELQYRYTINSGRPIYPLWRLNRSLLK